MSVRQSLTLRNLQHTRPIVLRRLRHITNALLQELLCLETYDLGVYLVAEPEMIRLNETFLHHKGSTDVITFDYLEAASPHIPFDQSHMRASVPGFHGEIFICVDEAIRQASRFRVPWQSELVRYLVHGVLHLCGYDDNRPVARRLMKREETRHLLQLSARFKLG